MDGLFSWLTTELISLKGHLTREKVNADVSDCIERFSIQTQILDERVYERYGVREDGCICLSSCHPYRVQAQRTHRSEEHFRERWLGEHNSLRDAV